MAKPGLSRNAPSAMIRRMSNPTVIVYGIPNCDTVKRARAWLSEQGIDYTFHDYKKQGVPVDRLTTWAGTLGWEVLVNRQGTTWRKLDEAARLGVTDAASALALMQAQPSVIKRPVVDWGKVVTVGFDPQAWAKRLPSP
jgi:Spx/MgsR family transcriptional regulator